jgi:hypothetical protein
MTLLEDIEEMNEIDEGRTWEQAHNSIDSSSGVNPTTSKDVHTEHCCSIHVYVIQYRHEKRQQA